MRINAPLVPSKCNPFEYVLSGDFLRSYADLWRFRHVQIWLGLPAKKINTEVKYGYT